MIPNEFYILYSSLNEIYKIVPYETGHRNYRWSKDKWEYKGAYGAPYSIAYEQYKSNQMVSTKFEKLLAMVELCK